MYVCIQNYIYNIYIYIYKIFIYIKLYLYVLISDPLEDKSVSVPPNVGKVDAKSGKRSVDLEAVKKTLSSAEFCKFSKVSSTPPDFVWIHLCPINPPTLFLGLNQLCYLHKT